AIRASVASSRERSPMIRRYGFGIGAPAIFRVRDWRRLPSPPARTSAQSRSRRYLLESSGPFNASIAGRDIWSTPGCNRRAATDGVGMAGGSPADQRVERRACRGRDDGAGMSAGAELSASESHAVLPLV